MTLSKDKNDHMIITNYSLRPTIDDLVDNVKY